jgi:curved DNA-binding protein CbpA
LSLRTHYDNLRVARDAPDEVIKAAYRALSQKYHPDRYPDKHRAEEIMKAVNRAYEVLSSPSLRREHDAWIRQQSKIVNDAEYPPVEAIATGTRLTPDPQKASGIGWLRFCRIVIGILFAIQVVTWIDTVSAFVSAPAAFATLRDIGVLIPLVVKATITWALWHYFNDFRRRINDKHVAGYGYPHPSMQKKWGL